MKTVKQFVWLLLLAGCQPSGQNYQQSDTVQKEEAREELIEPAVITFDEKGGEANIDRNFYFIFDVSGSMNEICDNERKIDGAKKALKEFMNKVPDDVNIGLLFLGVDDQESRIREVVPLGRDKQKFIDAIVGVEPQGRTPLAAATTFAMNKLIDQYKLQLGYGEYRMIVITDGLATEPVEYEESLKELKRYPFIALYGVGLCLEEDHVLQTNSIKYTDAHNYDEFGKALEGTISELETFDPSQFNAKDLENLVNDKN